MNIEKNKEDVNVPTPSPEPQMEDPTSNKEISQRPEEQVARDDSSCVSSDEEEDDLQQTPAGSDGTSPYGQILEHLTGKARRNFKRKMRRKRLELHMKALKSENASADPTPVSWGPRGGPPGSTIYINRPRSTKGPMNAWVSKKPSGDPAPVSWGPRGGPPGSTIYINRPRYTRGSMNAWVSKKPSGDSGPVSWGPRGGPPGSTIYINRPRYTPASSYTRGPMKRQADRVARKQPIVLPTEPASRREESVPSGRCVQDEPDSTRRSPDPARPSVRTSGTRQYRTPSPVEEEPTSSKWRRLGSPTLPKARSIQDKTDYAERPSVLGTIRPPSVSTRDTRRYRTSSPEEEEPASFEWRRRRSPTHPEARWDQDKTDYAERPSVLGTVRPPSVSTRGTRRYRTPSPEEEEPASFEWRRRRSPTHPEARWDQDKTDCAERPSVPGTVRPPSVSTSGTRQYGTPYPEEEEAMHSGWTRCGSPTHAKVRSTQDKTDYAESSADTTRPSLPGTVRQPSVSTGGTRRYRTPSPEEEEPASSEWSRRRSPTHPEARWHQDKTGYADRSPDTSRPSMPGTVRQPSVSTRDTRRYRTPSPEEEEPMRSGWTSCGNVTHPEARWDQDKTDYTERSPDPQPYGTRSSETAETRQPSVSTKRTSHYRTPSPEEVNDDYPISRQPAASTSQPTELQVVIRSDRPSGLVLPDEAERIRAYVVEESLRAMEEDGVPVLRFLNSGRIDIGWFLVIAYDAGTWDWLLTRLPPLAIGEQVFWAVRVADAPWPVRVGFRVRTEGPLCQERLERMLRLQNPTFHVREWMFLGAADEGREGECLVTFLISQQEATLLEQAGWTLFYELGAVTVQRLTVHGRDAVQDPSGADRRLE